MYNTLAALASSVVASSALIYFAGQVSLKALTIAKLMSKVEKPRKTMLYKDTANIRTGSMVTKEVIPERKASMKIAELLLGTCYAEGSKHISDAFKSAVAGTATPSGPSATASANSVKMSMTIPGELLAFLGQVQS